MDTVLLDNFACNNFFANNFAFESDGQSFFYAKNKARIFLSVTQSALGHEKATPRGG